MSAYFHSLDIAAPKQQIIITFEVLTAVVIKGSILWDILL
jgi:hypothetical protein